MKASKEIKGLRIISIADGTQIGVVKDLILNPKEGSLEFFVVDQPTDYFGAKVISFSDIIGLGEFALTVPDTLVIQDVSQNILGQELFKQDVTVIGTKVLTKKGNLIGEVYEYLVDEETGKISVCIINGSEGSSLEVFAKQIITFGKELLIIDSVIEKEPFQELPTSPANFGESNVYKEELTQIPEQPQITEPTEEHETEFNLFEQRQLQFFIGKTVDRDIILDNGEVLTAGNPITGDVISKITTQSKLMEISTFLNKN